MAVAGYIGLVLISAGIFFYIKRKEYKQLSLIVSGLTCGADRSKTKK
jgi:LPXTG-motif cell wall-anchored protein